jgi:succinate dehydrogenase/fumarate reductase flavoprotein subunit
MYGHAGVVLECTSEELRQLVYLKTMVMLAANGGAFLASGKGANAAHCDGDGVSLVAMTE